MNLDDLIRSKEPVLNALAERVRVNRLAEVGDVRSVGGFLGRRRHADLGGIGKVVENLAPRRILGGAAAMALVDDDEVEEPRRKLAVEFLALLRAGDGLVEP